MRIQFIQDKIDKIRRKASYALLTKKSTIIQNKYNLSELKEAQKVILFLVSGKPVTNGGIMSVFSLCKYARMVNKDFFCLIATCFGKFTYTTHTGFMNDEQIYRWQQIVKHGKNVKELILHIPELYVKDFYANLTADEVYFFKSLSHLHINIMNQNIELMPEPEELGSLYKLTNHITQTTAHHRYATQEICDKWQIPTHLFSVYVDYSDYKMYEFEEKEKIIVLSPDENPHREQIVKKLETALPDFRLLTVRNMTFKEYMNLISKAYFTITFGEGFDFYFIQPSIMGSLGFAVYNDDFFPNKKWSELENVYASYEDMLENIVADMIDFIKNGRAKYEALSLLNKAKFDELYSFEKFVNNLERFYKKEYDFMPDPR